MNHHQQVLALFGYHFRDRIITGIEIGTGDASLTKSLLSQFYNLQHLYSIDPYKHDPANAFESQHPQEWQDARLTHAKNALKIFEGRVSLLTITSDEAVIKTPDKVDFVWIDGDHTDAQVIKDIKNYYPKVKNGGIFGGHDYPCAIKHIKDNLKEYLVVGDDLTWWMIKNE